MKILVTGGAGYIGSVTVEQLLDRGHEVVVFDNLERGHREAVDPRARLVCGDLQDRAAILGALREARAEAVVHFAAYALVGESMTDPGLYFRNNVGGGVSLAEAMKEAGVRRLVFSSTCAVYGIPERMPITEELSKNPANPYGESKLQFEKILRWYEECHGFQTVRLRYFNAAGATERFGEDHDPETHIIPNVFKVALGQAQAVKIFGNDYRTADGTCVRDYIHIVDLAQAHILAVEGGRPGAYNLGNGSGYSVSQLVQTAREVTGRPIPAEVHPRRPGDPDTLVADPAKARRELGWKPKYPELRTILESAWNWTRKHPRGYRP
ncbi:MAG: UDP-glucose 4-epimerase GalE [Kiritimatiellia bacterium]